MRRLSPIKRTLRACATITSCPKALNNRLTYGECIPVSNAIRLRGMPPNKSRIAFGVVLSLCSSSTSPASSNTQYQLDRSPRVQPIDSLGKSWAIYCQNFTSTQSALRDRDVAAARLFRQWIPGECKSAGPRAPAHVLKLTTSTFAF